MSTSRRSFVATLALGGFANMSTAAEARLRSIGGTLVLTVPDGWRTEYEPSGHPSMKLISPSPLCELLVSAFGRPPADRQPALDPHWTERVTRMAAEDALTQSVEKSLPLRELRSERVRGHYFLATDRAPKPGEYKYMQQGACIVDANFGIVFTVLFNDNSRNQVTTARQVVLGSQIQS